MSATVAQPTPTSPGISRVVALRWTQLRAVLGLGLRIALRGKRIWILGFVTFLPAAIPVLHMILTRLARHVPDFPPAMDFFKNLVSVLYLHVLLYVLALTHGLAVISDEVEDKTLIHLMLRPLPRWVIVVGRFLSAWLAAGALLVGSLLLLYALAWSAQPGGDLWRRALDHFNLKILVLDCLILVFALGAYLALFSCVGAWLPHGERWGVIFCFGWENLITYLPARLKWMTLMYHVQTLFPHNVRVAKLFAIWGEPLPKPTCAAILLISTVVFLALTVWNLKRREIR